MRKLLLLFLLFGLFGCSASTTNDTEPTEENRTLLRTLNGDQKYFEDVPEELWCETFGDLRINGITLCGPGLPPQPAPPGGWG